MKMKFKHIFLVGLVVVLLHFVSPTTCEAYSLMLPTTPCTPALPYMGDADHYSGPACIQMIFNGCPDVGSRHLHTQADLYSLILLHNTEPTEWFSDPNGIRGTLMDSTIPRCGNWVDLSNTNKATVLGQMLYYMKAGYFTPVSIGNGEHWVTVIGYHTDVEPTSTSTTVTLLNIFFYDPLPGNPTPSAWVTGTLWVNGSDYWGVPHSKPGSSWDNKYIAVIEPPHVRITVKVAKWIREGRILPTERIKESFDRWIRYAREKELARGPFEILSKPVRIKEPILVKAKEYSYYLVPFADERLVAIFNAYTAEFEEFRQFKRPQRFILNSEEIYGNIKESLRMYRVRDVRMIKAEFQYDPKEAVTGRFSPTWKVQTRIKDFRGRTRELAMILNSDGQILKGLEKFPIPIIPREKEEVKK